MGIPIISLAQDDAAIAAAVREGRTVYDNLRKVILWNLPTDGGEALVIAAAVLFGLAVDADIVLDLHCDGEALLHLYTTPGCWPQAALLARVVVAPPSCRSRSPTTKGTCLQPSKRFVCLPPNGCHVPMTVPLCIPDLIRACLCALCCRDSYCRL